MRRAADEIAKADLGLAEKIRAVAARAVDDPRAAEHPIYRTAVAYLAEDIRRLLGTPFGMPAGLREEMTRLAGTWPGLANPRMRVLLKAAKMLGDEHHGLVLDARRAAIEIAWTGADQDTPEVRHRIEAAEGRVRRAIDPGGMAGLDHGPATSSGTEAGPPPEFAQVPPHPSVPEEGSGSHSKGEVNAAPGTAPGTPKPREGEAPGAPKPAVGAAPGAASGAGWPAGTTPSGPTAPQPHPGEWWDRLPGDVVFFDVETTGLHSDDRIVSLGMIRLWKEPLRRAEVSVRFAHLIFDPGKKSHPGAEAVHGYDDWLLRHQPPFSDHAEDVARLMDGAALLVAHNAEFDLPFLRRAFSGAGVAMPDLPGYCTMQAWRARTGGRAGLAAVAAAIGLRREGARHGALEDAWLCMQVYLKLHTPLVPMPFSIVENREVTNLRPVPPRPEGPLPRRKRRPSMKAVAPPRAGGAGERVDHEGDVAGGRIGHPPQAPA